MDKAFEKILGFIDEEIKIEESIAKSENEGYPITHQYGANCMSVIKKFVQKVAEEYNGGWIKCSSGKLPKERKDVEVTIEEIANDVGGKRYYTMRSWLQDGQWAIKKNPYHPTVIAWKYPTDPYKEREQNG